MSQVAKNSPSSGIKNAELIVRPRQKCPANIERDDPPAESDYGDAVATSAAACVDDGKIWDCEREEVVKLLSESGKRA